jgi:hypothetical protein
VTPLVKDREGDMSKPKPGDSVRATCGTRTVTGIVVRVERGAFWVETTDGRALHLALLPVPGETPARETSH